MQIGETMFVTGMCMFFMAPVSGQLMKRGVDPRIMLALGFCGFALGAYQASLITKDWDFNELPIHKHGAWNDAAAKAQKCVGAIQSHAELGRSCRAGDRQHYSEQAPRPASRPAA